MLSKEEIEKAKEILNKFINNEIQRDKLERDNRCGGWKIGDIYKYLELNPAIKTLLQYIDQLEKSDASKEQSSMDYYNKYKELKQENSNQNKIIDEMAKAINGGILRKEQWCPLLSKEKGCYKDDTCLKCLKQYFEKKVEEM